MLSNNNDLAIATDIIPTDCNLSDYYVFPENMAWTMAFTHEEGWYGPYFATHPLYKRLNTHNIKRFKEYEMKQKEIKKAINNGWL